MDSFVQGSMVFSAGFAKLMCCKGPSTRSVSCAHRAIWCIRLREDKPVTSLASIHVISNYISLSTTRMG